MGTPQELTDKEGKLLWSADYKAWGEATVKRTPSGMSQNIENNHRFQGQYFDKETGLHYNRFRYYDPHMARYISKDPIGLMGGINTSAYVQDPTQWVDPLGLNGKKDNTQDAYANLMNIKAQQKLFQQAEGTLYKKDHITPVLNNINSSINNEAKQQANNFPSRSNKKANYNSKLLGQRWDGCKGSCWIYDAKIFDYMVCSGSIGGVGKSEVINLHNGQIWHSVDVDPITLAKNVNKTQSGKKDLSIKSIASTTVDNKYKLKGATYMQALNLAKSSALGCRVGHIFNKDEFREVGSQTDDFLNGLAVSVTGGRIVQLGVTVPINEQTLSTNAMIGGEVGLGVGGGKADVNISVAEKADSFTLFDMINSIRK